MECHAETDANANGEQRRTAVQSNDEKYRKNDEAQAKTDSAEQSDRNHHCEPAGQCFPEDVKETNIKQEPKNTNPMPSQSGKNPDPGPTSEI